MSYDLFFVTPVGNPKPGPEQLRTYFHGRANYEVHDTVAHYKNNDTSVYFHFDFSEHEPDEEEGSDPEVAFNINYNRPSFFGLEAAPELQAFVDTFGYVVDDAQMGGMGENAQFTMKGFLKGWNAGNQFGVRAMIEHSAPFATMPRERLHASWNWNFNRKSLQEEIGENQFVPRIHPIELPNGIGTCIVWVDVIPALVPEVDMALIPLDEHKGFLENEPPLLQIPFYELRPYLSKFVASREPLTYWSLEYVDPPRALLKFVKKYKRPKRDVSLASWDSVIDIELVHAAQS